MHHLRYDSCVTRGSHIFTCHPHVNHTCLYSPAIRRHRPLAGTHCVCPRRDGQAELTWMAGYIPLRDCKSQLKLSSLLCTAETFRCICILWLCGCADLAVKLADWHTVLMSALEGATTPPSYMLDRVWLICRFTLCYDFITYVKEVMFYPTFVEVCLSVC